MPGVTETLIDLTPLLASLRRFGYDHTMLEKVARKMVPVLRQDIATGFRHGKDPDNVSWLPPRAGNPPLLRTGKLLRSIRVKAEGLRVSGSTAVPYAGTHQRGATLRVPPLVPRKAQALRWLDPEGWPVFATRTTAHRVRIPRRRFLGSGKRVEGTVGRMLDEMRRQVEEG